MATMQTNENSMLARRSSGKVLNQISQGILALGGLFVLYLLVKAAAAKPSIFFAQILNGLQLGFIYALIALGYTMIYGIMKLINFAHGDVFMVGAFSSFYAISLMDLHRWPLSVWPGVSEGVATFIGSATVILLAMVVAGILAVVMERFAYRPLQSKPRIAALITAVGVSLFLEYFAALPFVYTNNFISYPRPFEVIVLHAQDVPALTLGLVWGVFVISLVLYGVFTMLGRRGNQRAYTWRRHPLMQLGMLLGGFLALVLTLVGADLSSAGEKWDLIVSNNMLVIMISSIVLLIVLQYIVQYTRLGKAMRASAYDRPAARLMGINVNMIIAATFAVGGALAGAAGVLFAVAYPRLNYLMGFMPGLKAFVAAVIGGIGSIPGAVVGALIMGQAEILTAGFISTPMRDAIAFTMLIIVLLIRPQGIFGEPPTEKV